MKTILGAIAGDVIGSVYEFKNTKFINFQLFSEKSTYTDDTVLTMAVTDCILNNKDYTETVHDYARRYAYIGYGGNFRQWILSDDPKPYNSFGNGSAMRVSAVGFAYDTIEEVLEEAKRSAEITHNHPEGIKGAQAIASAIFLARTGSTKDEIKNYIVDNFQYDLDFTTWDIRPTYGFHEICQLSVPQAIVCFLESTDYENAIRLSISIGGDSDTIACMCGGIASAFYGDVPEHIKEEVLRRLPIEFIELLNEFDDRYENR